MKKVYYLLLFVLLINTVNGQVVGSNYSFSTINGTYSALSGGGVTTIINSSTDDLLSSAVTIPFTFQYGCVNFTQVKISSNGWLTFNTTYTGSNFSNDLDNGSNYNSIAPLWDDLATWTSGAVKYQTTGTSPNRIFKVEWSSMEWTISADGDVISFQCWLYEGTNRIDFVYNQGSTASSSSASASIGLKGSITGDFISVSGNNNSASISSATETDNLSAKPGSGRIYRFTPNTCSGTPTAGSAVATPATICSGASSVLSLSGTSSGCGLTYQWQNSSNNSTWSNIAGATSSTYTASPGTTTYYRCIVTCGASNSNSASVLVSVGGPANDDCSGAILLTPGATCSPTTGDITCASQSLAGCLGTANDDIWYRFVATNTAHIINLTAPSGFDPVVQVFSGSCGGTSILCNDADFDANTTSSLTLSGLSVGSTYWIRVYDYYTGYPTNKTFSICITNPPTCPGALGVVTNIASLPYSATGRSTCGKGNEITASNVVACGSSNYFGGEDEVYTFTPSASGQITITQSSTTGTVGIALFNGCPFSSTCLGYAQGSTAPRSICANVTAGTTYYLVADAYPSPNCYTYDISITAPSGSTATCNLDYSISTITYSVANSLYNGTGVTVTDDYFVDAYAPIGFSFCYDGIQYSQVLISSNGYIIFDKVGCITNLPGYTQATPSGSSNWSFDFNIPETTDSPRNAILAPWQDIHPGLGGEIVYQTIGTAPNRTFIVAFDDIPYYSCNTLKFKGVIKLFETSNNIEIHVNNKEICSAWNDGNAILGLQNFDGTIAKVPAGYNGLDADWTATNDAWRFTPNCPSCTSTLPVTYLDFTGESKGSYNELIWSTATETNNSHFIVERSLDGVKFSEIGTVAGNGNSNSVKEYTFIDKEPFKEITYYRLIQVDYDGKGNFSDMISIRNVPERSFDLLDVYPVPSGDNITVSMNTFEAGKASIDIMEFTGRILKSEITEFEKGNNDVKMSIAELPSGVYLVRVTFNGGDTQLRKIIRK